MTPSPNPASSAAPTNDPGHDESSTADDATPTAPTFDDPTATTPTADPGVADPRNPVTARVVAVIREYLADSELEFDEPTPGTLIAVLPGTARLRTTTSLVVGRHSLTIQAFVSRRPDDDPAALHRWLLERNRSMYGVTYCIDHLGDVYLSGRLPLEAVSPKELDRVLGSILTHADGDFNAILALGFESAIRREWAWRLSRGESTANLTAFEAFRPDASRDPHPA